MWILKRVLFSFLFIYYVVAEDVGEECVPNNEVSEGICTLMTECIEAVRSIRNKNFHQFQRCGFSGDQEVVCCPLSTNKFGPTEKPKTSQRIADRECQKIISSSVPPLALFIIGGELAAIGEFPHMVAMGFDRGNGYEFDCGGSLLSNTYVLTAAHCIETLDRIAPSMVRAGVVNLGASTWNDDTDVRVDQIITYPDYSRREKYHDLALIRREKYHDLALIRLAKPVEFSSYINAVCLYTGDDDLNVNMPLTITGWGQTNITTERRSHALLKANVTAVSREVCGRSYKNYRKLPQGISKNQLCAGDPEGLRDTCQGDSGGPLQGLTASDGRYRLIGVTSFGRGCGSPVPGVYTRISQYLDWIEGVVWPK